MNSILIDNLDEIKSYCRKYGVRNLYAFGSSVTSNFTATSDVDLLISFKDLKPEDYADSYFELHDIFERILGRKVDMLTDRSLHNPYFIESIDVQKQLLFEE